jgi:hypothetical protein
MLAWRIPGARWARCAVAALLACSSLARAAPSTFGDVIGNAVLCLDHIDNKYFYDYLSASFGQAYKHEGGGYWFKTDGNLWGAPIIDVIVSDDTSPLTFLVAVANQSAEDLEKAIGSAVGLHYTKLDTSLYPVRQSSPGSKIIYYDNRSKVFCAKYKPLPKALK